MQNTDTMVISPTTVKSDTTISSAAELLMDVRNPCLILEGNGKEEEHDYIVTPWDVVMKTLKSDHIIGGSTTDQI